MARLIKQNLKKSGKSKFFCKTRWVVSVIALFLNLPSFANGHWGFWAHKRINRLAVFRLPPEMQFFFKKNIDYLSENATNPDKRRYAAVGEAERHFIDLDTYGDSALHILPKFWQDAVKKIGEDSLQKHGIVPWHVQLSCYQLTEAFKAKDAARILRLSADLGHYIADAHVPLHTTRNYNGQLTNQEGIHGFWESRLPELFAEDYDLWSGPVVYKDDIAREIWKAVAESNAASDSVFRFEKELTKQFKADKKYSYELRNNILTRTYSREFSTNYHQLLDNQVELRMKASVKMVGDIWYTCWVNAGQPDLREMAGFTFEGKEKESEATEQKSWLRRLFHVRPEAED
ncbi:zinc dependent phospholipase C family protein [Dyadobacter arcticus]|uniref:S1/P1 Nuclease n=1 Tax=Dyadobacter arcticus TaxID=1078754 RepID=A0ABX0UKY5_9BACT|nr:zinc dependent phospholipase C family protein [Dyadobacter arcticus]NIJ53673.1 hypothetical protein [Dyadobacter arcticus]